MDKSKKSSFIKQLSQELGFSFCGIAAAQELTDDARKLEQWLHKGYHGTMHYMENHFDLRINPQKLFPGAQSVITLLKNYFPPQTASADAVKISKYAYGQDYHEVIRGQLKTLLLRMQEKIGAIHGRGFVDSAPVLERSWAVRSGLGWVGKNGNLINKQSGSFFFIATLIVDLPLEYDSPYTNDYCGTCTRCIDACPTNAILPNKTINGSQCISYYTIELKEQLIPDSMKGKFDDWMFGCDTCQDVCPWNRFAAPHHEPAFTPLQQVLSFTINDWNDLTETAFKQVFRHSPLKRAKFSGIQRNLKFIKQNPDTDASK